VLDHEAMREMLARLRRFAAGGLVLAGLLNLIGSLDPQLVAAADRFPDLDAAWRFVAKQLLLAVAAIALAYAVDNRDQRDAGTD
jgi:hypothetical protein